MLTQFERGLVAHLIADWVLQNDWMAKNKNNLKHPAAWIHTAIHVVALSLALGWRAGIFLGSVHLLVDTRIPLKWWREIFKQTAQGSHALHVAIWTDQVIHIASIATWLELNESENY